MLVGGSSSQCLLCNPERGSVLSLMLFSSQNVEFTLGEESEKSRKEMSSAELTKQLERLLQDKADNERIFDWIEVCPSTVYFSSSSTDFLNSYKVSKVNVSKYADGMVGVLLLHLPSSSYRFGSSLGDCFSL